MTSLVPQIPVANIYEPRIDFFNNNKRKWINVLGGQDSTFYSTAATSYSTNNITFNILPPSSEAVLDRQIILSVPVQLNFTGNGSGSGNILQRGRDAFRAFPISSCTTSLLLQINNYSYTIELSQFIHALSRVHSSADDRYAFNSVSPSFEDCYQSYADGDGANNNPLGVFFDESCNNQVPRGAYPHITYSSNTPTSAVINAVLYERVIIPPLIWQKMEESGLTKLSTFQLIYTLGNLQRMWSRSTANTQNITNLTVSITGNPTLYMNWLNMKTSDIQRLNSMPSVQYPHFNIQRITSTGSSSIAPNGSANCNTQVIQFNTIPEKIYLFLKKPDSIYLNSFPAIINTPDVFLTINSVTINFDNVNGVLSAANPVSLYNMSVKNGLVMSYPEFVGSIQQINSIGNTVTQGLTGSLIVICPGIDFPLRDGLAAGMLGKWQFQATLNVTNNNQTDTFTPDVYVVWAESSVLSISQNSAVVVQGVSTIKDVLSAPIADVSYNELMSLYGGSFGSKFRDFFRNAWNWVKDNKDTILSVAKAAAPLVGLGAPRKRKSCNGGEFMSRHELAQRLM